MNTNFPFLALAVATIVSISLQGPVRADEAVHEGMDVDLEALEMLNPNRAAKSDSKSVSPQPPSVADSEYGAPSSRDAVSGSTLLPEPQTPVAPKPIIVSTAPAGDQTSEALLHQIIPLLFDANSDNLGIKATNTLDDIAELTLHRGVRIQLHAYAGSESMSRSGAKRLALARAITIRGYLMDHGIEGSRIDLHPKGAAEDSPKERVDIIFLPQ